VVYIHIAKEASGPMIEAPEVRAVPRRGLEGDRYFAEEGTFSQAKGPHREITLIEAEALEAFEQESGVKLEAGASRRNITTRGVSLNDLVGREFRVGAVTLRGIRLCEPCSHLARLTHEKVLRGLVHRGGLRAEILTEGVIRTGDSIVSYPDVPG
jgi:MOSC domain-containing protein YiiM